MIRSSTSGSSHSNFPTTRSNSYVTYSCSKWLPFIIIVELLTFWLILLASFSIKSVINIRFLVILLSWSASESSSYWWLIRIIIMVVISFLLILMSIMCWLFVILRWVLFSSWLRLIISTLIIILSRYFTLATSTISPTSSLIINRLCLIISLLFFIILLAMWLIILRNPAIWNALFPFIFNWGSFLSLTTTRSVSISTTSSDWRFLIYSSIFIMIRLTFIRNILSTTRAFINMEIISASKWLISCWFSTYHTSTSATVHIICSLSLLIVLSLLIKVLITSSSNLITITISLIINLSISSKTTVRSITTTSNTLFVYSRWCS